MNQRNSNWIQLPKKRENAEDTAVEICQLKLTTKYTKERYNKHQIRFGR